MAWGEADPAVSAAIVRKIVDRTMADDHKARLAIRKAAADRRHAKALPTGMGLRKGERRKLRADIARLIRGEPA